MDTEEGILYEKGMGFTNEGEGTENLAHLDFFKAQIHLIFGMYLEGDIDLEEFIQYRNWPQLAIQKLGLSRIFEVRRMTESPIAKVANRAVEFRKGVKDNQPPKEFKNQAHKEFLKKILSQFVRSNHRRTIVALDPKIQQVQDRIKVLRKFITEKMNARKRNQENDSTFDNFKIYAAIMNVANEVIKKIENKNMIDSFNIDNFRIELQKSPIYLSDMNIRRKAFGAKPDMTYKEKEAEKVHLKRFLRDMDNKSSTHAQMVVSVFKQTVDRYYKHLRPPTPDASRLHDTKEPSENKETSQKTKPVKKETIKDAQNTSRNNLYYARTVSLDKIGSFIAKGIYVGNILVK